MVDNAHPNEAQRLVGHERIKRGVTVHMFEVEGRLRDGWADGQLHLFSEFEAMLAILQRPGSPALVCCQDPNPPLDDYFTAWAILDRHTWQPAFSLIGDALVDLEHAPGLYVVGDHNVCCLEDAFISGICAANRIIAAPAPRTSTPHPAPQS